MFKTSDKIIIKADKTGNHGDMYQKAIKSEVNKSYKKISNNQENKINIEAKKLSTDLKIADRINKFHKEQVFITVKYHKFPNQPSTPITQPN